MTQVAAAARSGASVTVDDRPRKSFLQICLATFCMVGIQFTWTVELSYGTPYLLSLELSKELTALVWLAGPLSGLIVQPVIGALSDQSQFRLGRRRPFIIGGSVLVCASMLGIAYAREIAGIFLGHDVDSRSMAIAVAVTSFYVLDFSLNAVQASCRSLIIDAFPITQQDTANAFASNMGNITNVFGYFVGYIDLVKYFPALGDSQMKVYCIAGILVFVTAMTITCASVHETPFDGGDGAKQDKEPWYASIHKIWQAFRHLPKSIQRLCNVQFFAWMGWFPFLFYSTTWVSGIYFKAHNHDSWDEGTRAGSFALLTYAIISVVAGTVLPSLTANNIISLKNTYTLAHVVFATAMLSTVFVETVQGATAFLGLLGISWACTMWIPFALIGEYLVLEDKRPSINDYGATAVTVESSSSLAASSNTKGDDETAQLVEHSSDSKTQYDSGIVLGVLNMYVVFPQFAVAIISALIFAVADITASAGPSASGASPAAAAAAGGGGGGGGGANDNTKGVGWVLQFGGLMAIIAAILSRRVLDVRTEKAESH